MYQFLVATSVIDAAPNRRNIHCTTLFKRDSRAPNRYRPKKTDVRITTTVVA